MVLTKASVMGKVEEEGGEVSTMVIIRAMTTMEEDANYTHMMLSWACPLEIPGWCGPEISALVLFSIPSPREKVKFSWRKAAEKGMSGAQPKTPKKYTRPCGYGQQQVVLGLTNLCPNLD